MKDDGEIGQYDPTDGVDLSVFACSECGYEVVSSAKVMCPNCKVGMTAAADAGSVESPWSRS